MTSTSHKSGREPTRPPGAGRRVWWALAGMFRFAGRALRGLIAAAVLLALVAGLPWALWHYVGWPLPNHVPTWAEVQGVLLGPMTTTFLLGFLACLCWITWAAFTIDVLRCTIDLARSGFDAARLPDFSAAGPMHALAAVLVGAVLLAVLGNRPSPAPPTSLSTALGTGSQVVATAPAWQHPGPAGETPVVRNAVFATQTTTGDSSTVAAPTHPESVVVLAPQNGIHDSLWRIAERTLGDGARWPEIFDLNKGKPQPNGHTFTKPSLIFPGEELALPHDPSAPTVPPQQPADPDQSTPAPPTAPAPPTTAVPPTSIQPSTPAQPAPSTQQAPPAATGTNSAPATSEPGFRWGAELFVGLGLAAAISAALLVARRRHNSRYRPGSGDRDDLPVAPVVYQLRLAHLRSEADDEIDLDEDYPGDEEQQRPQRVPPAPPLVVGAPQTGAGRPPTVAPGLGVRDGREVALDLATARGLGLVGAGAPAAARALLITALTSSPDHLATSAGAIVIVPADDLVSVLGRGATQEHLPSAVRVVADLDGALDAVEAETLVRATASREPEAEPGTWPPLVLVARPPAHHSRLQAVLDNGAPFGVTGLLLGQWQPGVTAYVRDDGSISATGPGLGEALRGTRMFRLGGGDAAELLALLRQAEPDPPATDELVAPPVPRPRIVAAHPAGNDQAQGEADPLETGGSGADEIELEVTAAVTQSALPDTELEILGPAQVQPPGARLRPPASGVRQVPSRLADDETEHHDEGEADEPASTSEPAKPVAETPPTTTSGGEQDTSPALLTVTVLGDLRVHWHPEPGATGDAREITGALQPRTKELLVLLALHPDGATRETLVSALWGQDPPARPTNALHTALSRMRSALATATNGTVTDVVSASNGRYQLDPASVRSDYWRFARAVAARRAAATDSARVDAYREVVNSYGGPLAEGMSNEWIEPAREAIRRDAIDAVAALARALVDSDPQQTLDLLEVARAFDPHNELLYRDIMRLQERLGQLDAIPRTLTLLTTRLAEVDAAPTPQARGLAARLGQRHEDGSAGATSAQAQGERGRIAAS
ncbi:MULTISPECIES: BTAD domain-containing putative transcriptional regulator [unclassified Crossiella]|uniref:BTAD domain-containing putative transcriptional regulator n=1 Tax=unclassified Crossiella TaxID=2620835 RepID=UPI0020001C48|nr:MULTISPECIES: BTAD domain-containing putative transcriptional regulator [unclassified Crossiella]MCK2238166.1 transcriptional regulator [Crossiella sp. S99.2]MCK2256206.1 transcriptional regulator [Crossiella sp. S99.1]